MKYPVLNIFFESLEIIYKIEELYPITAFANYVTTNYSKLDPQI
jgi:hypothetical protein